MHIREYTIDFIKVFLLAKRQKIYKDNKMDITSDQTGY